MVYLFDAFVPFQIDSAWLKLLSIPMSQRASTAITERRRKSRTPGRLRGLQIVTPERPGIHPGATFPAQVTDTNPTGAGLRVPQPLAPGSTVSVSGQAANGSGDRDFTCPVRVIWCVPVREGGFRSGISFKNPELVWGAPEQAQAGNHPPVAGATAHYEPDHYESLQVSSKADSDTIHRVYRILAQRYHPDNPETGHEESFRAVHQAYTVLANAELRAAYDVRRTAAHAYRLKIFARPADAEGLDGEKRKRKGVLMVLYTQRMNDPENPGVNMAHLEDLLGVPREHLEFPLWYLRENSAIARTDNGRYSITASGVDLYETLAATLGETAVAEPVPPVKLLNA